jgi:DNA-binding transcriptional MerR regulator
MSSSRLGHTAKHVVTITGISYQTLNLWAKTGLITPSIAGAAGSGSERVYSFADLVTLKVAVALRRGGLSTKSLLRVVRFLQNQSTYDGYFSEARLVVTTENVLLTRSAEELISHLSNPGQSYVSMVVDLPRAIFDVFAAEKTASDT